MKSKLNLKPITFFISSKSIYVGKGQYKFAFGSTECPPQTQNYD